MCPEPVAAGAETSACGLPHDAAREQTIAVCGDGDGHGRQSVVPAGRLPQCPRHFAANADVRCARCSGTVGCPDGAFDSAPGRPPLVPQSGWLIRVAERIALLPAGRQGRPRQVRTAASIDPTDPTDSRRGGWLPRPAGPPTSDQLDGEQQFRADLAAYPDLVD